MATIKILVDNSGSPTNRELEFEHGFSAFIEFEGVKILCDFGVEHIYSDNAKRLNIDLNSLDFAFVSHAHRDHSGGLVHFIKHYSANVLLSSNCFERECYSLRHDAPRSIGIDNSIKYSYPSRLNLIEESQWITDKIAIVKSSISKYPTPLANSFLKAKPYGLPLANDDFSHELSLVLLQNDGIIIISPCSHLGVLNIMESCLKFTNAHHVDAFVGGLHLLDSPHVLQECEDLATALNSNHPSCTIYTGHCTGAQAKEYLKERLNYRLEIFATGKELKTNN